jgi:hypothetical protein
MWETSLISLLLQTSRVSVNTEFFVINCIQCVFNKLIVNKSTGFPFQQYCLKIVRREIPTIPEGKMSELPSVNSELSAEDMSAGGSAQSVVLSCLLIQPYVSNGIRETALGTTVCFLPRSLLVSEIHEQYVRAQTAVLETFPVL